MRLLALRVLEDAPKHSIDRVALTGGATETMVTPTRRSVEVGGDFVYWLTDTPCAAAA